MTASEPIKIIMCGATGRMGRTIMEVALNDGNDVVGAICGPNDKERNSTLQAVLPHVVNAPSSVRVVGTFEDMPAAIFEAADVMIDFSYAGFSVEVATICAERGLPLVQGTTGLTPAEEAKIQALVKDQKLKILRSDNFSLGVNLLRRYIKEIAQKLPAKYNIECIESHHNLKKDAPSGTALFLADAAREGRQYTNENFNYGREGMVGERPEREIGIHAVRGGGIVGDHSVSFISNDEMITVSHRALNRDLFAAGAVEAGQWMARQTAVDGGLFSMEDVLGLL